MAKYKIMMTKWFLGTGGGDGCSTFFENWDDAKLDKYSIDPDEYDHSNMVESPSILIDNYYTHTIPYLTMIYLWDEKVDFVLSSKYNPLMTGTGEVGMPKDAEERISVLSSTTSSARKRFPKRKIKIRKDEKNGDGGMNESMIAIDNLLTRKIEEKKPAAVKK